MQPMWGNLAALAVVAIFYSWRTYTQIVDRRRRVLRERVAYMLWVMAERIEAGSRRVSIH